MTDPIKTIPTSTSYTGFDGYVIGEGDLVSFRRRGDRLARREVVVRSHILAVDIFGPGSHFMFLSSLRAQGWEVAEHAPKPTPLPNVVGFYSGRKPDSGLFRLCPNGDWDYISNLGLRSEPRRMTPDALQIDAPFTLLYSSSKRGPA